MYRAVVRQQELSDGIFIMFHEESWRISQASVSPLCRHYRHIEIKRLHAFDRRGHNSEEQLRQRRTEEAKTECSTCLVYLE